MEEPDVTAVVAATTLQPTLSEASCDSTWCPAPCHALSTSLSLIAISNCTAVDWDSSVMARGASAHVVRARDDSGNDWALKMIFEPDACEPDRRPDDPEQHPGPSMRERAQTEAEIAGALSGQPWAVPVHSTFRTHMQHGDGRAVPMTVLQMPFMGGGDLRARIAKEGQGRALPLAEAQRIILQAVNALHQCHVCGVLHRDIKAENILFTADGRLHLSDYGMSGFLSPSDQPCGGRSGRDVRTCRSTVRQPPGGSLELLSPARLQGGDDGTAGDWWSLGVVVLELLAGAPQDDSFWPFRPPPACTHLEQQAAPEGAVSPEQQCTQAWLQAVEARDIAFSAAVGGSGRELVRGLLHPRPAERWGLEEVLGCDFIPDCAFEEVARRYPCLARDMQELQEIREMVRMSSVLEAAGGGRKRMSSRGSSSFCTAA